LVKWRRGGPPVLREEQIDLRRRRARAGRFRIDNLGSKRVFSDFRVTNPESGGTYAVAVRGFDVGDNTCSCPDFKANTLGTCKHIEAVLASLEDEVPPHVRQRKAAVTRPEIYLHYGEQLTLGLHLPPRHSDALDGLAKRFFDAHGLWKAGDDYPALIAAVEKVLVVAPASVKYQWEGEIHKFTDRPVQVIDGTIEQRQTQYEQPTFYRLVNYEQATRDLDSLNAWQPDLVVLDEAQRIKNWESK